MIFFFFEGLGLIFTYWVRRKSLFFFVNIIIHSMSTAILSYSLKEKKLILQNFYKTYPAIFNIYACIPTNTKFETRENNLVYCNILWFWLDVQYFDYLRRLNIHHQISLKLWHITFLAIKIIIKYRKKYFNFKMWAYLYIELFTLWR